PANKPRRPCPHRQHSFSFLRIHFSCLLCVCVFLWLFFVSGGSPKAGSLINATIRLKKASYFFEAHRAESARVECACFGTGSMRDLELRLMGSAGAPPAFHTRHA